MWMLSDLWPLPLSPCDKWLQHRESMSQSSVALSAKLWNIILVHALNLRERRHFFVFQQQLLPLSAENNHGQADRLENALKKKKEKKYENWRCLENFQKVLRKYEKDVEQEANKYYKELSYEAAQTFEKWSF